MLLMKKCTPFYGINPKVNKKLHKYILFNN